MSVRVLIVDDSPVVRQALSKALTEDPGLQVVGIASNPLEAWELLERAQPDVITLDVEMPGMDGLTFLQRLMRTKPTRVVMVSSRVRRSSRFVMEALQAGALAVLPKPHAEYPIQQMLQDLRQTLRDVKAMPLRVPSGSGAGPATETAPAVSPARAASTLIAVGSSTGGTQAFEQFVRGLPAGHPCVVLAQHLPPDFVPRFVERLSQAVPSRVQVARNGEVCRPATILVAPATHHLKVRRNGAQVEAELVAGPPVNHHVPSCDVLLQSVARVCGGSAVGVILTGMGHDGAAGLLEMRRAGAVTFAQDEASSVVYGMPRAAAELGAATHVLPLDRLARAVMEQIAKRADRVAAAS